MHESPSLYPRCHSSIQFLDLNWKELLSGLFTHTPASAQAFKLTLELSCESGYAFALIKYFWGLTLTCSSALQSFFLLRYNRCANLFDSALLHMKMALIYEYILFISMYVYEFIYLICKFQKIHIFERMR